MNEELFPNFKERFNTFKQTEGYTSRLEQLPIAEVFKEIMIETLKNETLKSEHLTGLIQMFKYGCTDKIFDKYLKQNIADSAKREELSEKYYETDQWGFTRAGLNRIPKLKPKQLARIKTFMHDSLSIKTIDDAVNLCEDFDNEDIPYVTSGIYSPWLYYTNPLVFPILNNTHNKFRKWIGMTDDYPSCIGDFNKLNKYVNEDNLGLIDYFAHAFEEKPEPGGKPINIDDLLIDIHKHFANVWRCATSGFWNDIIENKVLTINWLSPTHDYLANPIKGSGKMSIIRWVNKLQRGDLIIILDRYKYYGIAVAKSSYKFKEKDVEFKGKLRPSIDIQFIHELKEPVDHGMNITHTNPATFYDLDGLSFSEKNTFNFLLKNYPAAIDNLINLMQNTNPLPGQSTVTMNKNSNQLNKILYGPPGTGKTYKTIDESLKVLGENLDNLDRETMKQRFAKYQKDKRVFFTTFHQNMAYEDFIEGIKPVEPNEDDDFLNYKVEDGLFMQACIEATFNYIQSNFKDEKAVEGLIDFNGLFDELVERVSNTGSEEFETKSGGHVTATVTSRGNFSIRHSGSDKSYTVSKNRLSQIYELYPNPSEIKNIYKTFGKIIGGSNSTANWSVLNAIAKIREEGNIESTDETTDVSDDLSYDDKCKIVKKYWNKKEYAPVDRDLSDPYVFVIDEINRGNVAQIFGELITLMEDDKRMGKKETIYAELPYSKSAFAIPPNLYIIGTMNTADRSVEALDTALRRRFAFDYIGPNPELLDVTQDGINLPEMLKVINKRLEVLKDSDHTLGHAWFWKVKNVDQLKTVFKDKVIPLLQEYFYNDYEKLGLVLGDIFFELQDQVNTDIFATFNGGSGLAGQYDQVWQYKLKPIDKLTIDNFKTLEQQIPQEKPNEE